MQLIEAKIESPHRLWVVWDEPILFAEVHLPDYTIVNIEETEDLRCYYIEIHETFSLRQPVHVLWQNQDMIATPGEIIRSTWFDEHYDYDGPLGNDYSEQQTTFRLWAPTAEQVTLNLFLKPNTNGQQFPMQYVGKGVYAVTVEGDCSNMYYHYHLQFPNGIIHQSTDPYAMMDDGDYSQVVPLIQPQTHTSVANDHHIFLPVNVEHYTGETSGLPQLLQHRFQGITTIGTVNSQGKPTGLDYLTWLAPTHLIFEKAMAGYQGSVTNPHLPKLEWLLSTGVRAIEEMQGVIEQCHRYRLNVLIEADLSHVYDAASHPLHLTVPGYYFRYDEHGIIVDRLGKGNELASERLMTRRYIINVLSQWLRYYQVDGFYLTNMTNFDEETVHEIEQLVKNDGQPALIVAAGRDLTIPEGIQRNQASLFPRIEWANTDFAWKLLDLARQKEDSEKEVANHLFGAFQTQKITTYVSPLQVVHSLVPMTDLPMMAVALLLVSQGQILLPVTEEEIDWNDEQMHGIKATCLRDWIIYRKEEPLFQLDSYEAIQSQMQLLYFNDQVIAYSIQGDEKTLMIIINVGHATKEIDVPTGTYYVRSHGYQVDLYPHQIEVTDRIAVEANNILILERR